MGPPLGSVISQFRPTSVLKNGPSDVNRMMTPFGEIYKSPGHFALFEAIRFKRHRQALLLLEAGVEANCKNSNGLTPLIYAVLYVDDVRSRVKVAKLLLDCDADPNLTDWNGRTAMMHACHRGDVEVVKQLVESKSTNIGMKDPDGNTALMHAAYSGQSDVISTLISAFRHDLSLLRLNNKNNVGLTAVQICAQNDHDECTRLLTREVQLFPNAINEFPDPKILEREPTPSDASRNNYVNSFKKPYSLEKLVHIGQYTNEPSHKNVGTNTQIVIPQTVDVNPNAKLDTDVMEEVTTYKGISEACSCELATCQPQNNKKDICHKSTQTPVLKSQNPRSRPKTSKITKILEPIHNTENLSIFTGIPAELDAFQRQRLSFPETHGKNPDYRLSIVEHAAKTENRPNAWENGFSISCVKGRRPESEPSILPLIPCISPLPPVKKNSFPSSKKYKSNVDRRQTDDKYSRDASAIKNNLFCYTS